MVTRGMKQVATAATLKLLGLAVIKEITADYIKFTAKSIQTIDAAYKICEELTEQTGILVVVVV